MKARPGTSRAPLTARGLALEILERVESGGAYASVLLDHARDRLDDPRERRLLRELVLGVLRRRSLLDHVLAGCVSRPLANLDAPVREVLRLGAYELLYLDRVPAFASVDRAVTLARESPRSRAASGLVNAVLRRVAREGRQRLPAEPAGGDPDALALYHAHPRWWVRRLVARIGAGAAARLMAADNDPAPTTLAVARRRIDPSALAARLRDEGVETGPGRFVPDALRVLAGSAHRTAAYREGLCWVQDEAAQLVTMLFGPQAGPRVADLCAAPGGKTLALLERLAPGGGIVACDLRPARLRRLRENLTRAGVADRVALVAADLSRDPAAVAGEFDDVLLDAPCTGTGTLRRHPEIRWRLRPGDPARLAELQGRLLDAAAGLVRPGGRLVYAVCSLESEEGEGARDAFLERHPGFAVADPRQALPEPARGLVGEDLALRTSPDRGGVDGFFATLLAKR